MESIMTEQEHFVFNTAFSQAVNAMATVLEKPEFNEPKIQNLVMLEMIGHITLSMHKGAKSAGPDVLDVAEETLTRYLGWLIDLLAQGGVEALPQATKQTSKAVN